MKYYKTKSPRGYSILGEKPPKIDLEAEYIIIEESVFFPHCVIIQRVDHKYFQGETTWIVPQNSMY